jgi:hypothetical protein
MISFSQFFHGLYHGINTKLVRRRFHIKICQYTHTVDRYKVIHKYYAIL